MAEGDESFHKLNTKSKDTSGYKEEIGDVIRYHRRQICNECETELNYQYDNNKGKGIIFVNKEFNGADEETRVGAEKDMEYLKGIYDKYCVSYEDDGGKVKNWHMNVSRKDLINQIDTFVESIKRNCPVIFVSISTHGLSNGKLVMSDKNKVNVEDMIMPFTEAEKLMGIPKVFIFQACRGQSTELAYKDTDAGEENEPARYATHNSDVILIYSTFDGNTAFRRSDGEGSWFLAVLYQCVVAPAYKNLHLVEILTVCSNLIINHFRKKPKDNQESKTLYYATQTPTYSSTLRKFLRFPICSPI